MTAISPTTNAINLDLGAFVAAVVTEVSVLAWDSSASIRSEAQDTLSATSMLFARIVLTVTGLFFFVHGLVCFIHP
ncbi:MAG: hypothetical protein WBN29_18745, partial [Polyangiales bacterium]